MCWAVKDYKGRFWLLGPLRMPADGHRGNGAGLSLRGQEAGFLRSRRVVRLGPGSHGPEAREWVVDWQRPVDSFKIRNRTSNGNRHGDGQYTSFSVEEFIWEIQILPASSWEHMISEQVLRHFRNPDSWNSGCWSGRGTRIHCVQPTLPPYADKEIKPREVEWLDQGHTASWLRPSLPECKSRQYSVVR